MTHQTLISSAPAFSSAPHLLHASSSSSFPFPRSRSRSSVAAFVMSSSPFSHHHGSLEEREGSMSALRSSLRPHEAAEEVTVAMVAGPAAWGAGDGFLVDDLLDLEELCEVEKEGGLLCEAVPPAEEEEEEEQKCSDSHGSSVVSYELMPLLPPEMDLPAHDAEELEWVSRIMDDSLAELPPPPRLPAAPSAVWRPKEAAAYPMRTPTICALSTEALVPVRSKKRSKRSRATTVWSLSGASVSDSASSSTTTTSSTSSSASLSSFFLLDSPTFNPLDEPPRSRKSKRGKPKKRGRKPKQHFPPQLSASPPVQGDRRCSHCGVQKTPQWRAGPEGAKTLCNACGVRFKSGRLLPEYRPACSPTFVGDLHSNSHRKVLEMRRKKDPVTEAVLAAPTVASF